MNEYDYKNESCHRQLNRRLLSGRWLLSGRLLSGLFCIIKKAVTLEGGGVLLSERYGRFGG